MNFNIRVAEKTEKDFAAIVGLLRDHFSKEHQMGSLSGVEFDANKCVPEIAVAIGCRTWIAENGAGDIVGSLGLKLAEPWYSSKPYYSEMWFYVLPEWRNSSVGRGLIKAVKQFASEVSLPVMIGIHNMEDTERKIKLLQKMGLKLVGGTFLLGE